MATEMLTDPAAVSMAQKRKMYVEEKEKESLLIIKQDVCDWLARHLNTPVHATEFMAVLDTGVLLCDLARVVQRSATALTPSRSSKIPSGLLHCHRNAGKESFHARDNAANFINWCRQLGVEEAVVFESEGLVLHKDERRVVLCLLEVARLASRLGISPPQLVELEREIEMMEDSKEEKGGEEVDVSSQPPKSKRRRQDCVDEKVLSILTQCRCDKKLQAISHGSGKFQISTGGSRLMYIFVRTLNDRVMVRVGGGWDTLDHFLLKIDPCRCDFTIAAMDDVRASVTETVVAAIASRPSRKAKLQSPYGTPVKSARCLSRTPANVTRTHAKVTRTPVYITLTPKCRGRTPAAMNRKMATCRTPATMNRAVAMRTPATVDRRQIAVTRTPAAVSRTQGGSRRISDNSSSTHASLAAKSDLQTVWSVARRPASSTTSRTPAVGGKGTGWCKKSSAHCASARRKRPADN